jgi:hypothetical protein
MKTTSLVLLGLLQCVGAALQNPCLQPEIGVITKYVVFTNAEGTDYYCADCTSCAAYAQNCTRYKNAICKEPIAIADDFVFALTSYCAIHIGIAIYYLVWHHKTIYK